MAALAQVKALSCPNCGGTVEIRGFGHALNAVCVQCLSVLDTQHPGLRILQQFGEAQRFQPAIPLGTRGKFQGTDWEAIGFQVREIEADGALYRWHEYLLFNPCRGFRYVTLYDGHWNWIRTVPGLPQPAGGARAAVSYQGRKYSHFQTSEAKTIFVMGEFPWQVRVGETASVADFVAAPWLLSSEKTAEEITWSLGEYTPGETVWKAFRLPGSPPRPQGVYANQPSPFHSRVKSAWLMFGLFFLAWIALFVVVAGVSPEQEVFEQRYSFASSAPGEHSFVTPVFELKGRPSTVEVDVDTDLENDWAFFNFALIEEQSGHAYDFGREVSYYAGRDSDGSWSEGGKHDSVLIPAVPAGHYYLRVEPEMSAPSDGGDTGPHSMNYTLKIRRGVPAMGWFGLGFLALLIPPVFVSLRSFGFERRRWQESDHPVFQSTSGGGGDDD